MKNKLQFSLCILAFYSFYGAAGAATNVNCTTNQATGLPEATAPWRNALGRERADGICKEASPVRSAAPAPAMSSAVTPGISSGMPPPSQQMGASRGNAVQAGAQGMQGQLPASPAAMAPAQRGPVSPAMTVYVPPGTGLNDAQPVLGASEQENDARRQRSIAAAAAGQARFVVLATDTNFRTVLTRWSRVEGWVFNAEHWTINKDIPVGGTEAMALDFKGSVRRLLDSTLMLDTPVKPCFYSNRVLRVVPETESCNRSKE